MLNSTENEHLKEIEHDTSFDRYKDKLFAATIKSCSNADTKNTKQLLSMLSSVLVYVVLFFFKFSFEQKWRKMDQESKESFS